MKEIFDFGISIFDSEDAAMRQCTAIQIANLKSQIENVTVALLKHGRGC